MSAVPEFLYISPEQYLLDDRTVRKYVNGRIYAMAGQQFVLESAGLEIAVDDIYRFLRD